MFEKIVRNQYVGKSKIDFNMNGIPIPQTTLIDSISLPVLNSISKNTNEHIYIPDRVILGKVIDISTMDLIYEKEDRDIMALYITGIPKTAKSIDGWRLKNVKWQSYYEDKYHGYLFQLLGVNDLIELKEESMKIKIKPIWNQ